MQKIEFWIEDKDWLKLRAMAKTAMDKQGNKISPEPTVSFVAKDILLGVLDGASIHDRS